MPGVLSHVWVSNASVSVLDAEGIVTAEEPPKSLARPRSRNRRQIWGINFLQDFCDLTVAFIFTFGPNYRSVQDQRNVMSSSPRSS